MLSSFILTVIVKSTLKYQLGYNLWSVWSIIKVTFVHQNEVLGNIETDTIFLIWNQYFRYIYVAEFCAIEVIKNRIISTLFGTDTYLAQNQKNNFVDYNLIHLASLE